MIKLPTNKFKYYIGVCVGSKTPEQILELCKEKGIIKDDCVKVNGNV